VTSDGQNPYISTSTKLDEPDPSVLYGQQRHRPVVCSDAEPDPQRRPAKGGRIADPHSASAAEQRADDDDTLGKWSFIRRSLVSRMMYLAFKYHQPFWCNIAGHGPRAAGGPGSPGGYPGAAGCGPSGAATGTYAALPETVGGPVPTLPGPDPGNAGASCLDLRSTTGSSTACSCTWSGEYNDCRFSLCGQPTGTNYITWSLCRHRRRVRTRLQVVALHWVLLHRTAGHLTRASPRSRTSGLLHSRRGTPPGRSRGTTGL